MPELAWLEESTRGRINAAVEATRRGVGEKLAAALLVGPAADPDGRSDARPAILVVVSELPMAVLANLAHQTHLATREAGAIELRLLTERELLRAADVLTVELEDYRLRHHVLVGADPFAELHFTQGELRRSLEHRARMLTRQLREALLSGATLPGGDPRRAFNEGVAQLEIIAFHALRLFGEDPTRACSELLEAIARRSKVDIRAVLAALDGDPDDAALVELLGLIDAVTVAVDAFGA